METKEIYSVSYIVYESGMKINDPEKSYYFKNDLDYDEDIICLNFYALKNVRTGDQVVRGDQEVRGNQVVSGYQVVSGNQVVRGDQVVSGYQVVRGNQVVSGYQVVRGDQEVSGYQVVRGDQEVSGDQVVRYIRLYLYTKWAILIDRDTDIIKIGCKEKTIADWQQWFETKQEFNLKSDSKQWKMIENGFKAAVIMKESLTIMNEKP